MLLEMLRWWEASKLASSRVQLGVTITAKLDSEVISSEKAPQASAIKLKTPTELVYLPSTPELSMPASVSMKTEVLLMSVLDKRKPLLLLRLPACSYCG